MKDQWSVSVNDGKYTVRFTSDNILCADRYGEPWRNCVGDNLIYWLAVELAEARDKLAKVAGQGEGGKL